MFTILDTETTGLASPAVCQIAWIKLDADGRVLSCFESLVNPQKPIESGATAVHGITDDMVKDKPLIQDLVAALNPEDCLIAHNAAFDARVLKPHIQFAKVLCTLKASRKWVKGCENYKLTTLAVHLQLPAFEAHSAAGDVSTCHKLVEHLLTVSGLSLAQFLEDTQREPPVHIMPFGKHKGKPVAKLPSSYRAWLLTQPDLSPGLKNVLTQLKEL